MKFYDEAKIFVRSGDGGNGCVSFRRERFKPRGGPDGGDGGKGGDVLIVATTRCQTLQDYHFRAHFKAPKGGGGEGNDKDGKKGRDLRLFVPLGTLIRDAHSGRLLADLTEEGQTYIAARGGRGGRGNKHFATSTHRSPRFAQKGEPGEEHTLLLELKLLAQVGLVGLPNAGKSTLLSRLSAARPKIADYPFTTLVPNLGLMEGSDHRRLVIADIPGIIAGAASGAGLGLKFLKHIERTRLLLLLLDGSSEEPDPLTVYHTLLKELESYDPQLVKKTRLVAINKMDLPKSRERWVNLEKAFRAKGEEVLPISALKGEGIPALKERLFSLAAQTADEGEGTRAGPS